MVGAVDPPHGEGADGEIRKLTKASAAIAAQRLEEIEVSGAKVRSSPKRCGLCRQWAAN